MTAKTPSAAKPRASVEKTPINQVSKRRPAVCAVKKLLHSGDVGDNDVAIELTQDGASCGG